MNHKQWLDNEYALWVKALQESTVHNFKKHPMVKRMLGAVDGKYWDSIEIEITPKEQDLLTEISAIGGKEDWGRSLRYIYYAKEILKLSPSSICEIGGGVGQFYAILRALGYEGTYWIEDLGMVKHFQFMYLHEVSKQTGLNTSQEPTGEKDFLCSFYALGEFDDDKKAYYIKLCDRFKHGYIAWNPHSGASDDLSLFKHDIKVTPGIEAGVKIIQW